MIRKRSEGQAGKDWSRYLSSCASECRDPRLKTFYGTPLPAAETPIRKVPLMALDFETTGMDPEHNGIVSIGMVPFTLERIHVSRRRYWIVRPREELREESVVIHHITHSEIQEAPDLETILGDVLETLAGHVPVVHYHRLERPFLDQAIRARLKEPLLFPMIDTMLIEAMRYRASWRARLRRWVGMEPESIRLQESRARYGLPAYSGHHALTDALATAELFQAQMAWRFSPETPLSDLWV